ncbi:MAG: glycosyltransferase family 2 protein [Methylovulum sp.]|nr:glycosyltransferase family 2 protein [Methylovulum sp.]
MIKDPVIAVVVAYHPKAGEVETSVKSLLRNFRKVVVVWNGPHPFKAPAFLKNPKVTLMDMGDNVGLARALNQGIGRAFDLGAAWVYLSDQDSTLPSDFRKLMMEYSAYIPSGMKVATIGPRYFNETTHEKNRFIRLSPLWVSRFKPGLNQIYAEAEYLITSGSFISRETFFKVGPMREELFIDFIDIEWSLRAKRMGYQAIALPNVMIHHRLGDFGFNFFGTRFPIHSPLRIYYYFRNAAYLYKRRYISLNWKLVDGSRNIFRFLFYVILVKPRLSYLRMALLGTYHGLIGRMGKL